MRKIFLYIANYTIDQNLNLAKKLMLNKFKIFFYCETLEIKKNINKYLIKEELLNFQYKILCVNEYLNKKIKTINYNQKDFINFEDKYSIKIAKALISIPEFNIYLNFFNYYKKKIDTNYESKKRLLLIEKFLDEEVSDSAIDYVFLENKSHFNPKMISIFFNNKKVPTFTFCSSIFGNFYSILNASNNKIPFINENFDIKELDDLTYHKTLNEIKNFEKNIKDKDREKTYTKFRLVKTKSNFLKSSISFIRYFYSFLKNNLYQNFYFSKIHYFDFICIRVLKLFRKNFFKRNKLLNKEINLKKKYIIFFLGLSPEASTYDQCNVFFDQKHVARFISTLLPSEYKLIIKEHPSQYISSYGRDPYYYKELLSHDNILFANNISSLQLIKNSQCVITSTGTSGIETIVLNKKLIMLGNNHYSIFKGINKVKTYEELSKLIENLGDLKRPSENERVKFFYHYKNAFFDGNIEAFYKKNSINKEEFNNELNIYSDSFLEIIKKLDKFKNQKFF